MSKTVTLYQCEKCNGIINEPKDGVVVHGNIYTADPNARGGLIGNNFQKSVIAKSPEEQTNEVAYCKNCFLSLVFPDLKIQTHRSLR